jgi:transmembrane sensor
MNKDRIWTLVSRKLSGEATASELAEIDELIKSQADNDLYLQAINEYWQVPPEKDEDFLEATYHLHLNRLKEKGFDLETDKDGDDVRPLYLECKDAGSGQRFNKKLFSVLGGIIAVWAICFIFYNSNRSVTSPVADNKVAQSEVATKSGSRTRIQLPDGSLVWLNGSSKLVYDNKNFGEKLRQVTLSGEAYFDVVKNVNKPFIIHTNKMDIKVLGTTFNVKAYPGEKNTEASLVRGTIEVTLKGHKEKIMMKPNDKLIVENEEEGKEKKEQAISIKPSDKADNAFVTLGHLTFSPDNNTFLETAWVENKLIFDNESFEDVAKKMERWYGVIISFNNNKLKSLHMTGVFEKETVTEALSALQLLSRFSYTIKNDYITIVN